MKRKLIVGNTLIALTALYILVNPVQTQAISTPSELWSQVAGKLGIGTDKVQTAFEQIRSERQKAHLDQLVKEGKLTQVQSDAILKKKAEWQAKREALRAERDTWFKSQNIDPSIFRSNKMERGKKMGGMYGGMR